VTGWRLRSAPRQSGSIMWLFRDYLRAHPSVCENYAALKKELTARWRHDRKAYGDSKTDFVLDTLADAAEWARATGWRA
jgi:GrpB-like predicted nucleotidyltransferase (UPF0157 family)